VIHVVCKSCVPEGRPRLTIENKLNKVNQGQKQKTYALTKLNEGKCKEAGNTQ